MDANFFLYFNFAVILFIITLTDMLYKTVDDRFIIAGTGFTLICQFYLGQIIFSLMGAIAGFLVSLCVFLFGNNYFSISNKVPTEENYSDSSVAGLIFPFVPSLTVSVVVHALLPGGLSDFLLNIVFFIKSHHLVSLIVVIMAVVSLYWAMRHKTIYINHVYSGEENKDATAFGDGDITASIFLGSVLGWQDFAAVFWFAMVIHLVIGIIILLKKQKGKFTWT